MSNIAVSMDDIKEALDFTPKEDLALALVTDNLGPAAKNTSKFERHLAAVKNKNQDELSDACVKLIVKHSPSISESEGCFLDSARSMKLDFHRALTLRLENLVSRLDSALTGSNPGHSMTRARTIVSDWQANPKIAISKHELTNRDLSIELDLRTRNIAVTPSSKVSDIKMMEASPILNELSHAVSVLATRRMKKPERSNSLDFSM